MTTQAPAKAPFTKNTKYKSLYKPNEFIDVVYKAEEGKKPFQHNCILAMFCDFGRKAEKVIDSSRKSEYC